MSIQLGRRGPYTGKKMELDKQVHNRVLWNKCEPKELRDMTNENNVEGTETFLWIVFVPIGERNVWLVGQLDSGVFFLSLHVHSTVRLLFRIVQPHCEFPYRKKSSILGISNGSEHFVVCADVLSVVW